MRVFSPAIRISLLHRVGGRYLPDHYSRPGDGTGEENSQGLFLNNLYILRVFAESRKLADLPILFVTQTPWGTLEQLRFVVLNKSCTQLNSYNICTIL